MTTVRFDFIVKFAHRFFTAFQNLQNPILIHDQKPRHISIVVSFDRFTLDIIEVIIRERFGRLTEISQSKNWVFFLLLNRLPKEAHA